jgi:uncharacterized protein YdhG (YjbR/CyaY superfamily)
MIDEYLTALPEEQRAALEGVRAIIKAAVPEAEEGISYGVPAFRLRGKAIAGFSASKNHLTYFPMSGATTATLADELKNYKTSKGAVQFTLDHPLSEDLIQRLLRTRIAELT